MVKGQKVKGNKCPAKCKSCVWHIQGKLTGLLRFCSQLECVGYVDISTLDDNRLHFYGLKKDGGGYKRVSFFTH